MKRLGCAFSYVICSPLKFVQRTMEQGCEDRVHDFQLVIEKGKKRKTIIVIRPNFLHPALRCECVLGAFDSRFLLPERDVPSQHRPYSQTLGK